MKKIVLLMCLLLIIVGCNKEEEVAGDLLTEKDLENVSFNKEVDISKYHLTINSLYEGKEYKNTIFTFLVNNNDGMYIYNYNRITNNIDLSLYQDFINISERDYYYYIDNSIVNIIYNIDGDNYLDLSINAINSDLDNLDDLLILFDFNIDIKY